MALKRLAILGSTGSIGQNTLAVAEAAPERFAVVSLAAATSVQILAEQARRHRPEVIAVKNAEAARALEALLPAGDSTRVVHGPTGYLAATLECRADMVLSAMVGSAGLVPTFAAVAAGIDVALANKESLVAGGELVMAKARETGAAVLPVDSEHSALFQAMMAGAGGEVRRLWLTASGGPFRDLSREDMEGVTPEQALKHPNWSMGAKITVDSATLMNKGLEVIEAHWLFDQPLSNIKVVVHPQSLVHSLVEFKDGNLIAQLGPPDMRLPIAFALGHPERLDLGLPTIDPTEMGALEFSPPDLERFPALGLAYRAGEAGGTCPAALSGANEVAVQAFLERRLSYTGIARLLERVLERHPGGAASSVEAVLHADQEARRRARQMIEGGETS